MDLDPLNAFGYSSFSNYVNTPGLDPQSGLFNDIKVEPSHLGHHNFKYPGGDNFNEEIIPQDSNQEIESKPNIQTLVKNPNETRKTVIIKEGGKKRRKIIRYEYHIVKRVKKEKAPKTRRVKEPKKPKQRSTYWSEKIRDPDFKFYACAICDINYMTLAELDIHVSKEHKNRVTSYDLRIQKELRKKQLRKEKKRNKKAGAAVKVEEPEIVIKPEGGYIGTESALSFDSEGFECKTSSDIGNNNENYVNDETAINTHNSNSEANCNGDSANVPNHLTNKDDVPNNSSNNTSSNKNNSVNPSKGVFRSLDLQNVTSTEKFKNLEKIYKCYACKKQFLLSYYLKLHVRSHTDEKPYTCSVCGQKFITASKLGRHNKRIHLSIKHQCRICFKDFSRFEYLTRHFDKTHPEDKLDGEPYDYNAILPYLKELEEQLSCGGLGDLSMLPQPETNVDNATEDRKPKAEELWPNKTPKANAEDYLDRGPCFVSPSSPKDSKDFKKDLDMDLDMDDVIMPTQHLVIEELRPPEDDDVKIKIEVNNHRDSDGNEGNVSGNDGGNDGNDADDGGVKDEQSDDEFFPANTWATTPKPEPSRVSPDLPKTRRKKTDTLKCPVCDKTINTASYYRIHMRTHTGEKPFRCYICNRGFITSSKMHRHVLTHNESWEDGEDKKPDKEDGKKIKEEKNDDDKKDNESLKKAKAKFAKKKKGAPSANRNRKRPHACDFCQKKFLHQETLQVHKRCHEGQEKSKECNFCLITVKEGEDLATHEATHTGPKPYLCTVCGRSYKRRETMVYHKKHHKPEKTFICDICSKIFNSATKLQRHIVGHSVDKYILRYECPVCAHMFNTKYHIQMHLSTHQKEGLILEENRNDILAMVLQNARKIPKSADLQPNSSVTDLIPADERSRVCNICGEMFQHFYYLEEHLKSHGSKIAIEDVEKEEERKHICPVCNKGFKLHYYLKLHSFTHTKEKPFICQQCGKGFITKGKLKRHLETHTGLKKYQCHICYKFFTRPSYLRIHVRTIHGTQDYNFRISKEFGVSPYSLGNFSSNVSVVSDHSM